MMAQQLVRTLQVTRCRTLINGINGAGLGVSAGLATNANKNQLSFGTAAVGAATALSGTMTITAGANTFTYNSNNTNPVTGGAAEDTVQGLIDSINASGDGLNAYLDGSTGALQIVDTNANNDIAAHSTGTLAGVLGTNSNPDVQQLTITDNQNRGDLTVTNTDSAMGFVANPTAPDTGGNADSFVAPSMSGSGGANVFISDGDVTNPLYNTIKIAIGPLSSTQYWRYRHHSPITGSGYCFGCGVGADGHQFRHFRCGRHARYHWRRH